MISFGNLRNTGDSCGLRTRLAIVRSIKALSALARPIFIVANSIGISEISTRIMIEAGKIRKIADQSGNRCHAGTNPAKALTGTQRVVDVTALTKRFSPRRTAGCSKALPLKPRAARRGSHAISPPPGKWIHAHRQAVADRQCAETPEPGRSQPIIAIRVCSGAERLHRSNASTVHAKGLCVSCLDGAYAADPREIQIVLV